VVIPTKYNDPHCWADCVEWFIRVVKHTVKMYSVPNWAIVGLAHFVWKNAAFDRIKRIWLVNNHMNLVTYSTVL
jgi:hypothetical protein